MIKRLSELSIEDTIHYGTKASNIGVLMNSLDRDTVPDGFALSINFFDEYMKNQRIDTTLNNCLKDNLGIRDNILNGDFLPEQACMINDYIKTIKYQTGSKKYAVRSSALLEDTSFSSMAGMFESYVNIDADQIDECIKKVYASLYADKVIDYIYENNIDTGKLKMGVIIQEFIEGKPSGIVFTADTIDMNTNTIQIHYVDSICDDFVKGSQKSYSYTINKQSGEVMTNDIEPGNHLDHKLLVKLCSMAKVIENHMGTYQDIEWTYTKGNLYILQTRPITTMKTDNFITTSDISDTKKTWYLLRDTPFTPLLQDVFLMECDELGRGAYESMTRTDTYGEQIIQNGYAYGSPLEIDNADIKTKNYSDYLADLNSKYICIFTDTILPDILKMIRSFDACYNDVPTSDNLIKLLNLSLDYLHYTYRNHWHAANVNVFLNEFQQEFLKEFDDMHIEDYYDLIYGFSKLARERELLFKMADIVNNNAILKDIFLSSNSDILIYNRIKNEPSSVDLLSLIDTYTNEFYLCDAGHDTIMHPTLSERPDYCISSIKEYMNNSSDEFFNRLEVCKSKKQKVTQLCLDKLDITKHKTFLSKVSLAEKALLANDDHNFYMERSFRGPLRLATIKIGNFLVDNGLLDSAENIQYLYIAEILQALKNYSIKENLIKERKELYRLQKAMIAPDIIGLKPPDTANNTPATSSKHEESSTKIELQGMSGLRKSVTGKVHVGMPKTIEDDIILVLPHCHQGDIMPLISKIKGFVFNWDSPYEHYGIIAREMGIPAIYKTKNATEVLKTGDIVHLDGFSGIITLLKRA